MLFFETGIKINELDKLDAQGFNRSQIASHAIEAYLIQVQSVSFLTFKKLASMEFLHI